MVHAFVARTQFHRLDVSPGCSRNRDNEIAIYVLPAGREGVRLWHLDHQVWLAELPALGPGGQSGQFRWRSFDSPIGNPLLDHADLVNRELTFAHELAEARLRRPRGHIAALRNGGDVLGMLFHLGVSQQIEWPRLARTMAVGTMIEDYRGNILGKGHGARRTRHVTLRRDRQPGL